LKFKDNTVETIDIPIFIQQNILSKSYPTFQLKGIVGDYPLLYNQVDKTAKINQGTGVTQTHELFDVDVNLKGEENSIRGFSYLGCRITDYTVASQHGNEESFFFWFALDNTFEFECTGYDPKIPSNDSTEKPDQNNNKYWPDTQRWSDEFRYIPRDKSN